jgi:shikimate dehydrogenase
VPLKKRGFELAAASSPAAAEARAANTLSINERGQWLADNTDGAGLVNDLSRNLGINLHDQRICLIGAGGAANGVLGALLENDPQALIIANRTEDRAAALAERFSDRGNISACSFSALVDQDPMDLVINATSVGHEGKAPDISASLFNPGACCYDMNYGSAGRPLQALCDTQGIRYFDGLGMLLEQAACSFELWTGIRPSTKDFSW